MHTVVKYIIFQLSFFGSTPLNNLGILSQCTLNKLHQFFFFCQSLSWKCITVCVYISLIDEDIITYPIEITDTCTPTFSFYNILSFSRLWNASWGFIRQSWQERDKTLSSVQRYCCWKLGLQKVKWHKRSNCSIHDTTRKCYIWFRDWVHIVVVLFRKYSTTGLWNFQTACFIITCLHHLQYAYMLR